ncbi:LamG domain-containing protein [Micromonospora citrea]|uniref:LamG domain-containing protein n=1 Tax=Micromonospora citrea TaxID=47855 RepID=UPI001FDFE921|nr:LamG domain-containing protein [Micromonospora citrea]
MVKDARAAADPRLRELRFDLGGDARVVRGANGRLTATAGGEQIASAEPAVMWDSATAAASTPGARAGAAGGNAAVTPSSSSAPGDRARTAPVGTEISARRLVLRPDAKLLAPDAAYPVYIDPAWSTGKSRWAYATNNNTNNTDTTVARVGRDPDSGKLYRSYFDFPLSALKGKHIESAYVQMKLDHSWSCTSTPTYMYHSAGIASTPRTGWSPKLNSLKSSASSHANEGYGCSDSPQPDMTVNFTGSAVTSVIQTHATNNWTNITLAFCACSGTDGSGESTTDRWKKFWPASAKLVVDFDSVPGAPRNLQAQGVACTPDQRIGVATLNPTLSAIFPDADSTQALTTAYEWLEIPGTGTYNDSTPRKPAPVGASVPAGGRSVTAPLTGLVEGRSYAFRARATDPAPYSRTSPWSPWCEFRIDTKVPPVSVGLAGDPSPLPGTVVTFGLSSTDTTVTKFRYGWVAPGTREVPATTACSYDAETGTSTCVKKASVSLSVPKYGQNTLHVKAIDGAGNVGDGSAEFVASRPSPAVARWGLEDYPGVEPGPLADGQPALRGDTPLTATDVTWAKDARIVRGHTATLNGTTAHLRTAGPVVDTSKSYGVAAWVRLSSLPTQNMAVATQSGACMYGFFFGVVLTAGVPKWNVTTRSTDCDAATYGGVSAPTAITSADVGRWQHVAFSYDEAARTLTLFVDGVAVATAPWTSAWNATNGFQIGRHAGPGVSNNHFKGSIADVQVYDRALVEHDFTGQRTEDPGAGGFDEPGMLSSVMVGDWDFAGAVACYEETTEPFLCEAPEAGQFGRRLALTKGVATGDDGREAFLSFDSEAVDDPTQATVEYGRSQDNTGTGAQPVWQDGRVLRTDQSFSVTAWVRPKSLGMQTAVAQIGTKQSAFYLGQRQKTVNGTVEHRWSFSVFGVDVDGLNGRVVDAMMTSRVMNDDDLSAWTHLVGVYDQSRREVRLYVNGNLESTVPYGTGSFTGAFDATGPLYLGAARYTPPGGSPLLVDRWHGDIDDVGLRQGALNAVAVKEIFAAESTKATETVG